MNGAFLIGPRHIFKYISLVRTNLSEANQKIVMNVVERIWYLAHPENIVLAMLTDEDGNVREQAAKSILKSRKSARSHDIRKFTRPKMNLAASNYHDLSNISMVDPPFTQELTDAQVLACVESADNIVRARAKHIIIINL